MLIDTLKKENLLALKNKDENKRAVLSVIINKYMILGYEYKGMTCRYWRKYAEKNGFYQKTAPVQNNVNQSAAAQPQQQAQRSVLSFPVR